MLRLKSSSLLSLTNQVVVSNVDAGKLKFKLLHQFDHPLISVHFWIELYGVPIVA